VEEMSQQKNPSWILVDSSAISAISYDEQNQTLAVRFLPSGAEYEYANVTAAEHTGLTTAGSIGKYFNAVIKPTHEFTKIK
jgi:hypothetical protein